MSFLDRYHPAADALLREQLERTEAERDAFVEGLRWALAYIRTTGAMLGDDLRMHQHLEALTSGGGK